MFDFLLDAVTMIVTDVLGFKIGKRTAWTFLAVVGGFVFVFVGVALITSR